MDILRAFGRRLWVAHLNFQEHDGTLSAAGIAYYVALSFFPLLLVLVAALSWILQWTQIGQTAWQALHDRIANQLSPDLAQQVARSLRAVSDRAPATGPLGFVVLVASAILIFAQMDAAFDRIWRLPSDPHASWFRWIKRLVFQRLKALGMLIGLGGFLIVAMVASVIVHAVEERYPVGPWIAWATSFWVNLLLNLLAFTLVYRVIPRVKIRWVDAARGGLLATVLWELGRQALAAYFLHLNYPSAYGIIGSFIAVMLWAFYASLVLLFGAEYVRVLREEANGKESGRQGEGETSRAG
jgi:membrane protein